MKKVFLAVFLMMLAVPSAWALYMNFPSGVSRYVDKDGNRYTRDFNGQANIPNAYIHDAEKAGLTRSQGNSVSASTTCTKNTWSNDYNMVYFCYSTNKQVRMFNIDRAQ